MADWKEQARMAYANMRAQETFKADEEKKRAGSALRNCVAAVLNAPVSELPPATFDTGEARLTYEGVTFEIEQTGSWPIAAGVRTPASSQCAIVVNCPRCFQDTTSNVSDEALGQALAGDPFPHDCTT